MPRVQARLADVVPVEPHEEREGPEKERLEHADLEVRLPHPKSTRRVKVVSRRDDRVGRH
jgi:hypothetical protein